MEPVRPDTFLVNKQFYAEAASIFWESNCFDCTSQPFLSDEAVANIRQASLPVHTYSIHCVAVGALCLMLDNLRSEDALAFIKRCTRLQKVTLHFSERRAIYGPVSRYRSVSISELLRSCSSLVRDSGSRVEVELKMDYDLVCRYLHPDLPAGQGAVHFAFKNMLLEGIEEVRKCGEVALLEW